MCGVVAVLGRNVSIDDALNSMSYRGVRQRVADLGFGKIGHVRLPIVGVGEEYDQPYQDPSGNSPWTIAFVGEILNFRDQDPGAPSDLPVVVNAWTDFGPGGFTQFDGFWSVVAMDRNTRSLFALVDYLAQKPLYYRTDIPSVASEIDALVTLAPVTPDHLYLSSVCKWGYCPNNDRTPFAEIHKIPPGGLLWMQSSTMFKVEVVDPLVPIRLEGNKEDVLRDAIEFAVARRVLASDVPMSVLLSGGLDSSIVYELAKRHGDLTPYSIRQSGVDGDADWGNATRLAGDRLCKIERSDFNRPISLDERLEIMQEPIDLGSLVPQIHLSNSIRWQSDAVVCLTGDGADEMFGGYGRAHRYDSQYSDVFHELVMWHLPRLDRVMMRNYIEIRSPFLARRVAGIALGLPRRYRIDKNILRTIFKDILPSEIVRSKKNPLRTEEAQHDRGQYWFQLVEAFKKKHWGIGA